MADKPKKSGRQNYDWKAIKHDYVTDPDATLRKIADKYGIRRNTVYKKSKADDWFATRKKVQAEIGAKAIAKTTDRMAAELSKESDYLQLMKGHMGRMLQDDMQFQRHLIETRVIDEDGSMIVSPEEKIFNKFDSRSMKDSMQILKMMEDMTRSLKNIQKAESIQKQQLDRERFEFEKEMAQERLKLERERIALERERNALRSQNMSAGDESEYGVVLLPEILPEVMPDE